MWDPLDNATKPLEFWFLKVHILNVGPVLEIHWLLQISLAKQTTATFLRPTHFPVEATHAPHAWLRQSFGVRP